MMTIEVWVMLALAISLSFNLILVWLSWKQSSKLLMVSENISDLLELITNYRNHLKSIYSMEMFYGDETLEYLMRHTNSLMNLLEVEYGDIIAITDRVEYEIDEEEKEIEEESEEQIKDVLYAGTRRRDT